MQLGALTLIAASSIYRLLTFSVSYYHSCINVFKHALYYKLYSTTHTDGGTQGFLHHFNITIQSNLLLLESLTIDN